MSETFYNPEYEDARQWCVLIDHEYFNKLVIKIELEITRLQNDIDKCTEQPTLDNSIKATALAKGKEELKNLLLYFNFIKQKKSHLDKRNVERAAKAAR